jgi:hypothetical protein
MFLASVRLFRHISPPCHFERPPPGLRDPHPSHLDVG